MTYGDRLGLTKKMTDPRDLVAVRAWHVTIGCGGLIVAVPLVVIDAYQACAVVQLHYKYRLLNRVTYK